jgi:hypothetical protein
MASFLNEALTPSVKAKREETYDDSTPNVFAFSTLGWHYILYFPISISISISIFFFSIHLGRFRFFLHLLLSALFSLALSL